MEVGEIDDIARQRAEFQAAHAGHDTLHLVLFFVLCGTILLAQIGLVVWRRKSPRSYHLASLFLLWLIPAAFRSVPASAVID